MKKKLGILIAIVMLVSLVFSTAAMAALKDKWSDIADVKTIFSLDGETAETLKAKLNEAANVAALEADTESGANGQIAKFGQGADISHTYGFLENPVDASAYDGIAVRFKSSSSIKFNVLINDAGNKQPMPDMVKFVALDGTVTDSPPHYEHNTPADFNGYILLSLDSYVPQGGGAASREGNVVVKNSDGSEVLDLTAITAINIQSGAADFYMGNIMLYKLDGQGGNQLPDLSSAKLECKAVIAEAKDYSGDLVSANNSADSFYALEGEGTSVTASDGSINIAFGEGSKNYQYIHCSLGKKPTLNFSAGEALAFRVKTNAAVSIALRIDFSAEVAATLANVKLLSLDGKFVEAELLDDVSYKLVIPKNFDGYVLYYLDKGLQSDTVFTRDGAFMVDGDDNKYSLKEIVHYVMFASTADGNDFTGNEVLSIQGIYVVDVNANGGNGGNGGTNPPAGAPLMIGTALTALASCAFVLKGSKKKA